VFITSFNIPDWSVTRKSRPVGVVSISFVFEVSTGFSLRLCGEECFNLLIFNKKTLCPLWLCGENSFYAFDLQKKLCVLSVLCERKV